MAILAGNVIGNLKGKLGNLSARTISGRTILGARPSSFNASQDPAVLAIRQRFAATVPFAKAALSLTVLFNVWKKVKTTTLSVYNTIVKYNFPFTSVDGLTVSNIITPDGFTLPVTVAAVAADKVTATIPALNTITDITADEVNLSVNALVSYSDPTNQEDVPLQVIALNKELPAFDFTAPYELQMDLNVTQQSIGAKYTKNILYLMVASKNETGALVQNSATFSLASE